MISCYSKIYPIFACCASHYDHGHNVFPGGLNTLDIVVLLSLLSLNEKEFITVPWSYSSVYRLTRKLQRYIL